MTNHKYLCIFFLLFCSSFSLFGQKEEQEPAKIEFRTLALDSGLKEKLFFRNEDGYEELSISHYRPSQKQKAMLTLDGKLPFFKKVTNPETGIEYVVTHQVAIPTGSKKFLLLAANLGDRIGFNAIQDNLGSDNDDWLLINASRLPVLIQVGKQNEPIPVSPGRSVFHRVDIESGTGAVIKVAAKEKSGWNRTYSTVWPIYEGQRMLVIFIENNETVEVRNFFESIDEPTG